VKSPELAIWPNGIWLEFQVISLWFKGEKGKLNQGGIRKRNGKRAKYDRLAPQISWSGRSRTRLLYAIK
jgi:hypothetical protein